jgi:hypothetical protein
MKYLNITILTGILPILFVFTNCSKAEVKSSTAEVSTTSLYPPTNIESLSGIIVDQGTDATTSSIDFNTTTPLKNGSDVSDQSSGAGGDNGGGSVGNPPISSTGGTAQICNGREHCIAMKILSSPPRQQGFYHGDIVNVEVSTRGIVEGSCSTVGPSNALMNYGQVRNNATFVMQATLTNPSRVASVGQYVSLGCKRQNSQADIIQHTPHGGVGIGVASWYLTPACTAAQSLITDPTNPNYTNYECGYVF